jgi:hypothetical protein
LYLQGQYNEQVFRAFDYVLDQAAKHGVRLIAALANNWDAADHSWEGINQEDSNVDNKWVPLEFPCKGETFLYPDECKGADYI